MTQERDKELWRLAKERAGFKIHATVFVVVILLIWIVAIVTNTLRYYPWPIWPTIGWGIGVVFHYLGVYRFFGSAEREYEKLKNKQ